MFRSEYASGWETSMPRISQGVSYDGQSQHQGDSTLFISPVLLSEQQQHEARKLSQKTSTALFRKLHRQSLMPE